MFGRKIRLTFNWRYARIPFHLLARKITENNHFIDWKIRLLSESIFIYGYCLEQYNWKPNNTWSMHCLIFAVKNINIIKPPQERYGIMCFILSFVWKYAGSVHLFLSITPKLNGKHAVMCAGFVFLFFRKSLNIMDFL